MDVDSNRLPEGPLPRKLADRYMGLVRRHAYRLARRIPSHISVDDLIGAGSVGLADALNKFDRSGAQRFEAYADCRIRGAMLDELRSQDPLSRDMRGLNKRIVAVVRTLTAELGRTPEEVEIAQRLNVTVGVFRDHLTKLAVGGVVSLDTAGENEGGVEIEDDATETGEAWTLRSEQRQRLVAAIRELPERLQLLLELYYEHDFSLREIGERLGVTESRTCQLHAEAIVRLRAIGVSVADESEAEAPIALRRAS